LCPVAQRNLEPLLAAQPKPKSQNLLLALRNPNIPHNPEPSLASVVPQRQRCRQQRWRRHCRRRRQRYLRRRRGWQAVTHAMPTGSIYSSTIISPINTILGNLVRLLFPMLSWVYASLTVVEVVARGSQLWPSCSPTSTEIKPPTESLVHIFLNTSTSVGPRAPAGRPGSMQSSHWALPAGLGLQKARPGLARSKSPRAAGRPDY
jgi:hypothetical protein